MSDLRYGFVKTLANVTFDDTIGLVTKALDNQGFGVLTEIDVKKTLKKKLNQEFRRYTILGACNPTLAKKALDAESQIGLLLPCNVVVQEGPEEGVTVSVAEPSEMFTLVENPNVAPIANEAGQRLRHVLESLG